MKVELVHLDTLFITGMHASDFNIQLDFDSQLYHP